ncbi:UDP-D-xylose:L-fucose alpha-1,3-D-xylosyltransferase 3-like [Arabidopsis lyrata subsp. lyrata]|uniref:UDP-D-xylose:L-fucose alpha-1,3-D-xylosyltransferase 3-like n=1 Tax=Arabidopsis lyrata subsp. lyrata TaxID=81972 RepID=UPI000A29B7D4|nr:UDP-D-xylose:L-fucose alpha-1,3-D-xylosyltransferase 3-like [Arabidopsis lyrata subsp. lyrata]|eukprot:XP_020867638.1 UDP-D-xylose:L-fucose alpha-1,3-D-xylosyltransferase 3-like [Arabidopsis lyrata subsp. lyrata]
MKTWVEEIQAQPWNNTQAKKPHDQPAFNWALHKTANQVDVYLLPQSAFPSEGLYFKNETWVNETKGKHVIVHNNYIIGYERKIKRFQYFNLWLVDDHALESPLGILKIYQEQNTTTEGKNQTKTVRKQRKNRGKKHKLP